MMIYTGLDTPMRMLPLHQEGRSALVGGNHQLETRAPTNTGLEPEYLWSFSLQIILGVSLSRDLMAVAGDALKTNIRTLGPLVLPLSEQLLFMATLVAKKLLTMKKVKSYIPDFKLAFKHFCIHAGGRAVLDELESNLALTDWHM